MEINKNIAEENSININNYIITNTIVKDKPIIEYISLILFWVLSIIFIIEGIININYKYAGVICIVLGILFLIFGLVILLHMLMFEIIYKDDVIIYKDVFKNETIEIKNIQSFKVETDSKTRYYTIEITYNENKKIKYHISYTNKENFVLLLNLLKSGIKQIY